MKALLDLVNQLSPLIQVATLLVVIFYTYTTWLMARVSKAAILEMKLSREEQAKPKVVCYFEHNERRRQTYDLVIRNYGNSAAFNVNLVFSPQLERYGAARLPPLKGKTFQIMAPGYEWRTFWDSFPGSDTSSMPDEFIASVSYDWDTPQKHETYEVHFDIRSLMGRSWLPEPTIEDSLGGIAESLRGLVERLEKRTNAAGY